MKTPELLLDRFCGGEIHPITKATWNLYEDKEFGMSNLCFAVEAGQGTKLHEDTETLRAEPSWEVNLLERGLDVGALVPGAKFSIPTGYDETRGGHVTNFYYCEHESSESNTIEILEVDGDRLRIRLQGETIDVNYYDGSKPPTKLFVDTWFVHDKTTMRSMQ